MSANAASSPVTRHEWSFERKEWWSNRPLSILVGLMLITLAVALIGLVVDPRIVTGAPAWMKPAKFAISIAIYGATLIWLLRYIQDRPVLVRVISWIALIGFTIEMVLITMQVVRGTTSHFNFATPFDATVFRVMGGVIVGMWLLTLVVALLLFRRKFADPAIVWGVRTGIVAALLGMAVAFFMPQPTPAQLERLEADETVSIIGAHSVGVEDGGPGLPVVGWSTTGGDLRVAHFVGIHGLQVAPAIGWLIASFAPGWLSARGRGRLAIIAGLAWIGLTFLLLWQALRGQSLIAPDALTIGVGLGGLVIIVIAAVVVATAERRTALVH
jgi:hypothetical protein